MFVKYLTEGDLIIRGFEPSNPSNLHPESFAKTQFNEESGLSTMMNIWIENNIYHYKICTDRESTISRGVITKKEQLDIILKKFFEDDYVSYLERTYQKSYSPSEKVMIRMRMKCLSTKFFDIGGSAYASQ